MEQLDDTPGLEALDGGAGAGRMPSGPLPDAALVDADRLESYRDGPVPAIGIGRPAAAGDPVLRLPLRIGDAVARIHAAVRASRDRRARFRVGPAEFDHRERCVRSAGGRTGTLTAMESEMLLHLCRSGARAATRDELLRAVWGYSALAETHTVETHVWRLRSVLDEAGCGGILRRDEGGYRLDPAAVPLHDTGREPTDGG